MESVLEGLEGEIENIMAKYPTRRSGMLPVLWLVQRKLGHVPDSCFPEVGECVGSTSQEVEEVVSFYTMYHRRPVGKFVLQVCRTLSCALCGGIGLLDYLQEKLGVGMNETTPDGLFTIQEVECLCACSEAPLMMLNEELKTRLTREKVDQILDECRAKAPVSEKQAS